MWSEIKTTEFGHNSNGHKGETVHQHWNKLFVCVRWCVRIRPSLGAQLKCEVMCIQIARAHGVDESLSDGKRPAMEDSEWGLLINLQLLHTRTKHTFLSISCSVLKLKNKNLHNAPNTKPSWKWIVKLKNLDVFKKVQISWRYRLLCPDEGAVGLGFFLFSFFHTTCSFSMNIYTNPQECRYRYTDVTSILILLFFFKSYALSHTHTWLRSAGLGLGFCRRTCWSSAQIRMIRKKMKNEQIIAWREAFLSVQYLLKLSHFGFVKLRSVWIQKLDGKRTSCRRHITKSVTARFSKICRFVFPALAQLS